MFSLKRVINRFKPKGNKDLNVTYIYIGVKRINNNNRTIMFNIYLDLEI